MAAPMEKNRHSPSCTPTRLTVNTERFLSSQYRTVFAAFGKNNGSLARWLGPKAFTNPFEQFAFNGRRAAWIFVMHGAWGPLRNESVFRETQPD